jgi:hypothetical protein
MHTQAFIAEHEAAIRESFGSFSYATRSQRLMFDDAVASITDPEKLETFKRGHEDRERSSMNRIVQRAWSLAKSMKVKPVTANN